MKLTNQREGLIKMEKTYNGFTNWETWNFMLWNGEVLEEMIFDYASDSEMESISYSEVYEIVDGFIDEYTDDDIGTVTRGDGFMRDAMDKILQKLDTQDIAERVQESVNDHLEDEHVND